MTSPQLWSTLPPVASATRVWHKLHRWYRRGRYRTIPLEKLLLGGESTIDANRYARLIGEPLRPSRTLAQSPHVQLLQHYQQVGEALLEPSLFETTPYFKNARQAIEVTGRYFEATQPAEIYPIARGFLNHFTTGHPHAPRPGTRTRTPALKVRPIRYSDCFEIIDGHHRLAIAYMNGQTQVRARCAREPVLTPLQQRVLDVLWQQGRTELYQPLASPELGRHWTLVRRCTDRFQMMQSFCAAHRLLPPAAASYLDVGASYGWFVAQMAQAGFQAHGTELDPFAIEVGTLAYGLHPGQVTRSECVRFLRAQTQPYDLVSCFSVLHHFALGKGAVSAAELLALLDRVTTHVLFLDTGQNHEAWFRQTLPQWDPPFIENWIKTHSSFTHVYPLGTDQDRVPPYQDNYSRTLFACLRQPV